MPSASDAPGVRTSSREPDPCVASVETARPSKARPRAHSTDGSTTAGTRGAATSSVTALVSSIGLVSVTDQSTARSAELDAYASVGRGATAAPETNPWPAPTSVAPVTSYVALMVASTSATLGTSEYATSNSKPPRTTTGIPAGVVAYSVILPAVCPQCFVWTSRRSTREPGEPASPLVSATSVVSTPSTLTTRVSPAAHATVHLSGTSASPTARRSEGGHASTTVSVSAASVPNAEPTVYEPWRTLATERSVNSRTAATTLSYRTAVPALSVTARSGVAEVA